ncbi:uncharacterized protein LOC131876696 [Cryptomeria japonica]|uniref:uncharacterized protein LOC131876696 n=1 Tax=Cryptomeria japonica TaxID=3369 RepID=UPI0027D9E6D7|nr:uncharacterized protein LOC131876696 [Cryptomeria japonica]
MALGAKLAWRIYASSEAKWARIVRRKYMSQNQREAIFREARPPKGSRISNFIRESQTLIMKYLSWDIHDGRTTLFWEDSWGGHPSIDSLKDINNVKDQMKSLWGNHVRDYMVLALESITGWTWKNMSHLLVDNIDQVLLQILEGKTIILRPGSNELIWSKSKNGQYNCKEGFRTIYEEANIIKDYSPNTICLDKSILPKDGFFAWVAFQGKVLTTNQFKLRGTVELTVCTVYPRARGRLPRGGRGPPVFGIGVRVAGTSSGAAGGLSRGRSGRCRRNAGSERHRPGGEPAGSGAGGRPGRRAGGREAVPARLRRDFGASMNGVCRFQAADGDGTARSGSRGRGTVCGRQGTRGA